MCYAVCWKRGERTPYDELLEPIRYVLSALEVVENVLHVLEIMKVYGVSYGCRK